MQEFGAAPSPATDLIVPAMSAATDAALGFPAASYVTSGRSGSPVGMAAAMPAEPKRSPTAATIATNFLFRPMLSSLTISMLARGLLHHSLHAINSLYYRYLSHWIRIEHLRSVSDPDTRMVDPSRPRLLRLERLQLLEAGLQDVAEVALDARQGRVERGEGLAAHLEQAGGGGGADGGV